MRRKCPGLKLVTEAEDGYVCIRGRGAFYSGRSCTVRSSGLDRRENAGISSENNVRIIIIENLRFPGEGSSAQGKSGPKPRANAVGDGQQVDIPVPPVFRLTDAVTQ
jgi:hypothetical protein